MILGIDEVGRGPWAGPLVVGAVVLKGDIAGLADSKKLSAKKRQALNTVILEQAAGWGLGWVSNEEIDRIGLSESLRLATRRAVEAVHAPYHEIIIDGTVNFLADTSKGPYVTTLKKADALIPAVSAAAIIAKVARDAYMARQDAVYPGYSFGAHAGYGTAKHQHALQALGVSPLHRKSFAPVAALIGGTVTPKITTKLTSSRIGQEAEQKVATYLEAQGHVIVSRNWKTRYCEIDIVSESQSTVIFTEVKYRSSARQGGGRAAITPQKLQKMSRAAESYAQYKAIDKPLLLAVAEVTAEGDITYLELS